MDGLNASTASAPPTDDRGCPSGLEPAVEAEAEETQNLVDPEPFVTRRDGAARLELAVYGARCAGCISKIEGGVSKIEGVRNARLNLSTGKLAVEWADGAFPPRRIVQTLAGLGYRAAPFDPAAAIAAQDEEGRFLLRCLAVAGFATANVMLLSVAVWAGHSGEEMGEGARALMHWVSGAIALPAAAFAGRPFFRSAWNALKAGGANMDVPISLAVMLACSMSVYETLHGGDHAYFDAAVMLLFFLLIGRYLDHRLRARARAAAQDLIALQTTVASRLSDDGTLEAVAARDVAPGDRLVLAPGDRAPVDGFIEEGASEVDMSLVTGESAPERLEQGARLYSGVVNLSSRLVMRASAGVDASLVADLTRLLEAGEQGKSRYIRLADRAARAYVPIVHSLALATFLGWYFLFDGGMRGSVMNAVAVLIITCPCALGLAAPAVQVVATGRLFKRGVLVKSGDALERLAEATAVVFDKTGTLTHGKLKLSNADDLSAEETAAAAALARTSRHPLARAIVAHAGAGAAAEDAVEHAGLGVEGVVAGVRARLGSAAWVGVDDAASGNQNAAPEGVSAESWLRLGGRAPVRLSFEDGLRADAPDAIAALNARGLRTEMLTGDRQGPAARVATLAGLSEWRAEASPHDKIARLKALSDAGEKVVMVGDGLNDAPSLAAAHASLSPGTAADAAQAAADCVFQGDRLSPVVEAYDTAKSARARVLQNFAFAAAYNAVAAPLAALGHVTPLIAALAMSGSSLVVTLNALRGVQSPGPARKQGGA